MWNGNFKLQRLINIISGFRGGTEAPLSFLIFDFAWNSFYKMLFNFIFRNVNVFLLCITNTPTMLYAACPENWNFLSEGGGGVGGGERDSAPSFWIFWIHPWYQSYSYTLGIVNQAFGNQLNQNGNQSNFIHGLSLIEFRNWTKLNIQLCGSTISKSNELSQTIQTKLNPLYCVWLGSAIHWLCSVIKFA